MSKETCPEYFPNGFDNWVQTHHFVSTVILMIMQSPEIDCPAVDNALKKHGEDAMYKFTRELTDKFEREHPDDLTKDSKPYGYQLAGFLERELEIDWEQ